MNSRMIRFMMGGVLMPAAFCLADTMPASISRKPLMIGRVSERLSVGAGYDRIERGISWKDGPDAVITADSISGYVGFDIAPWLTLFATAGSVALEDADDTGTAFSAGLNAYLWEADVLSPAFMAGRMSIKAVAEAARFQTDTDIGDVSWMELTASLPIGYELFDRYPTGSAGIETSLALYAGPAVSAIRGTVKWPFGDWDFDEKEMAGLVAGADVFLSPQVSIGAKVTVFDEVSYGASARFHF